jgi:hypothetical protein
MLKIQAGEKSSKGHGHGAKKHTSARVREISGRRKRKSGNKSKDNSFITSIVPLHKEDFDLFDFNLLDFSILNFDVFSHSKGKHAEKKDSISGKVNFGGSLDHRLNSIKNRDYTVRAGNYLGAVSRNYTYSSDDSRGGHGNIAYGTKFSAKLPQAKAEKIMEYNSMYSRDPASKGHYRGWSAECARRRNDKLYMELKMDHPNKKHFDAIRDKLHPVFYFTRYGRKKTP